MKTVWKNLWAKLPTLPRRWKIIRNLAAVLLLAGMCLRLWGWPSLTPYGAYQRLEGEYLLAPSELVLQVGETTFLTEGEGWVTAGIACRAKVNGIPKYLAYLHHILPKDGLVVVGLPEAAEDRALVVAVKGVPNNAVSGVLELDLERNESWNPLPEVYRLKAKETFTAEARREENDWFFFYLKPHHLSTKHTFYEGETAELCLMEAMWTHNPFASPVEEFPYRLTLLDGAGNEVERVEGTLPPNQMLWKFW